MEKRKWLPPLWRCKHSGRTFSRGPGVCLQVWMQHLHHSCTKCCPWSSHGLCFCPACLTHYSALCIGSTSGAYIYTHSHWLSKFISMPPLPYLLSILLPPLCASQSPGMTWRAKARLAQKGQLHTDIFFLSQVGSPRVLTQGACLFPWHFQI
jgi:hypothetical protein